MSARRRWSRCGAQVAPSSEPESAAAGSVPPWPVWCTELELGDKLAETLHAPSIDYRWARVLLRLHDYPIGHVTVMLDYGVLAVDAVLEEGSHLLPAVTRHLAQDGVHGFAASDGLRHLPAPTESCPSRQAATRAVTVAIPTRDRSERLGLCLSRVTELDMPGLEILVVDNAPSDEATFDVVATFTGRDPRVRYVREPSPGVSSARNRALVEARTPIVAFLDDDVTVDQAWLAGLERGFRDAEGTACVTGPIHTAAINGPAELYFDTRVSWGGDMETKIFRPSMVEDNPLFPYAVGSFGTGASFAVDTHLARLLGGFDERLGVGTASKGGEDLDFFVRVILEGYTVVYAPSAVCWHHHRAGLADLRKQMFGYGSGLSAFLTKHLVHRKTRKGLVSRIPYGLRQGAAVTARTRTRTEAMPVPSRALLMRELAGFLSGPVLYARVCRTRSALSIPMMASDPAPPTTLEAGR